MTASTRTAPARAGAPSAPIAPPWTCPFCPLLCDDQRPDAAQLRLPDDACPLARRRLHALHGAPAGPRVHGRDVSLDEALEAAAALLSPCRQPLIAGLGCDVAGARALYPLAAATGAICDAAQGEGLTQALRAQQDRGGFTTTLAEIRERADLMVFAGSWAPERAPQLLPRCTAGRDTPPALVALGTVPPADAGDVEVVAPDDDLATTLAVLTALVAERRVAGAPPALQDLAQRLKAANYAVLVWEQAQLGAHAALLIERLQQLVGQLNLTTRAAGFPLGGGDGAATANQVFTWLTGLPLRTRLGERLHHEPLRYAMRRLLDGGAIDALLWVNLFSAEAPPATTLPRLVLGPAALASQLGDEGRTVFIPVATPGLHSTGHLFRTDGVVLMPLHALRDDGLPTLAEVAAGLLKRLAPAAQHDPS